MTYHEIFDPKELVGYFASIVVILSFLLFNETRYIRVGNLIGALIFIIYGFLIDKIPIIILNGFLVMIQLYFLLIKKST